MAASEGVIAAIEKKQKAEKISLMDIAKEAQEHVRKMLPLGAYNKDKSVLESLNKKLLGVFNKSFPLFDGLCNAAIKVPSFVASKLPACRKAFLSICMNDFLQEVTVTKFVFTQAEREILPGYCASILRNVFFGHVVDRAPGISTIVSQESKNDENMASVLGSGTCSDMVIMGCFYILRKYGERKDLYPMCTLSIVDPESDDLTSPDAHDLFMLHYDPIVAQDPNHKDILYCDFWIDRIDTDLLEIIQVLPQPLKDYALNGGTGSDLSQDAPISEAERQILMTSNPYAELGPMFHSAIKKMYESLTTEKFPSKFHLVDEPHCPPENIDKSSVLTATEWIVLSEWHRKGLVAIAEGLEKEAKKAAETKAKKAETVPNIATVSTSAKAATQKMLGFSSEAQGLSTGVAAAPATSEAVAAAPGKETKKKKKKKKR